MLRKSNPPILLKDLIEDLDEVVALFERNAPYTPLGGWFRPDRGEERYRSTLSQIRASVLWKADIYENEDERRRVEGDSLSLEEVARVFNHDLALRGADLRFDLDRLDDPALALELGAQYPEPVPIGAGRSLFDPEPAT